jgi:ribosomal protein L21
MQLQQQNEGRLFAVVHICGKQFKVTTEDLVIIEGHWAPQIGDQLKLEKVEQSLLHLCCVANNIGYLITSLTMIVCNNQHIKQFKSKVENKTGK